MLEILIISAILTAKLLGVDRERAKRGETPPGYRLIEKWLDGRKARGQAPASAVPAKYGMWRYFWQRWQALWELLSQEHESRHRQRLDDRAEARARGEKPPRKPRLGERAAQAWQWVLDQVDTEPRAGKTQPPAEEPVPAAADEDVQPDTAPGDQAGDDTGNPTTETPVVQPGPSESDHAPDEKENDMAQQTGEVTGIPSAIQYAKAVAAAHSEHSGNEGYLGSLANMEVGQGDIAKVQAAMEASANAAAMWGAAADSLQRNNNPVREAYASAPDAANKQGNTNE